MKSPRCSGRWYANHAEERKEYLTWLHSDSGLNFWDRQRQRKASRGAAAAASKVEEVGWVTPFRRVRFTVRRLMVVVAFAAHPHLHTHSYPQPFCLQILR